jgi:hypothetical protein
MHLRSNSHSIHLAQLLSPLHQQHPSHAPSNKSSRHPVISLHCIPGAGLDMLPRYEDAGASRLRPRARHLFEPRRAAAHDFALADELGIELGSV